MTLEALSVSHSTGRKSTYRGSGLSNIFTTACRRLRDHVDIGPKEVSDHLMFLNLWIYAERLGTSCCVKSMISLPAPKSVNDDFAESDLCCVLAVLSDALESGLLAIDDSRGCLGIRFSLIAPK